MTKVQQGFAKSVIACAVAAAIPSMASAEGFQLSEKLGMTGFIDMSTTYTEVDPKIGDATSRQSTGLDQFEINLNYSFDEKLSAVVDMEYQPGTNGNGDDDKVDVEQGYISYGISEGLSFKAGKFLSYSGWETEDPTGLFQYSGTGYGGIFYGGYQQGVSTLYSTDMFDVALSVVNAVAGDEDFDSGRPAIETMLAFRPAEGATIKAFYINDKAANGEDTDMINMWASYAVSDLTLAVEVNSAENSLGTDEESSGGLFMVNYAMGDFGITARYHAWEVEDTTGTTVQDVTGITISPSYAVTDNLLLVAEVRQDTDDVSETDTTLYALEALVTF